jgi:uncharacterized membrane protein YcaP (DUF421 family)
MPSWIQAIIYLIGAIIFLRISGKRTISQMTPSEVAIMIGIGTVLAEPLKSKSPWISLYHGALIITGLLLLSHLQLYFPKVQKWIMGEPLILIKNGKIIYKNLQKSRMTVDELKMKLRIKKVTDISKVKSATLEVSGDLGVALYVEQSFATKKDIEDLKKAIEMIGNKLNAPMVFYSPPNDPQKNLFAQVEKVQEDDTLL